MSKFFVAAVFAIFACANVFAKEPLHLPEYAQTCYRDSINANSCILKSLKHLQPYLVNGIPQLNLPSIDPYKVEKAMIEYHNGQIHGKLGVRDFAVTGLKDVQFEQVRANFEDLDNFKLDIDVSIPRAEIIGRYKLQGKFIELDFGGKGVFNITMDNFRATWAFTGSQEVVDGVRYMKMTDLHMEPVIGNMRIYVSDLFNGNEALSKTALALINQYWRVMYNELLPYAQKDWSPIMTEIANRVFMKVPFDEIFPVSKTE